MAHAFRPHKGKWTATVKIDPAFKGPTAAKSISETFSKKRDAQRWADDTASAIRLGTWADPRLEVKAVAGRWEDRPLRDTIERYRLAVTPQKKGAKQEATLLLRWEKHPLAERPMKLVTRADMATHRDQRQLEKKAPSTIKNELNTLSAVFTYAKTDWAYEVINPVDELRARRGAMPASRKPRDRRLQSGEQERLERALATGLDGDQMLPLWRLLLDTGMRLSEALGLDAGAALRGDRSLELEETKNGEDRTVLLSDEAWAELCLHVRGLDEDEPLFGTLTVDLVEYRYRVACAVAKVKGFRIHDLRHEAISRMFARDVDIKTVMLQSGHRTPTMLLRYLNPTVEERRRKLFGTRPAEAT